MVEADGGERCDEATAAAIASRLADFEGGMRLVAQSREMMAQVREGEEADGGGGCGGGGGEGRGGGTWRAVAGPNVCA